MFLENYNIVKFQFVELIRAHFYTPFGVLYDLRVCTAPKPPLCKGRWAPQGDSEGLFGRYLCFIA